MANLCRLLKSINKDYILQPEAIEILEYKIYMYLYIIRKKMSTTELPETFLSDEYPYYDHLIPEIKKLCFLETIWENKLPLVCKAMNAKLIFNIASVKEYLNNHNDYSIIFIAKFIEIIILNVFKEHSFYVENCIQKNKKIRKNYVTGEEIEKIISWYPPSLLDYEKRVQGNENLLKFMTWIWIKYYDLYDKEIDSIKTYKFSEKIGDIAMFTFS